MTVLDDAIARINDIGQAMTTVTIKSAADFPTENADPFPMMVAYVTGGQMVLTNATMLHVFPEIAVEFHFSRTNLKQAQQQINATIIEFSQRIAGDPTLNALVDTVVAGQANPITFTQREAVYGSIKSQMLVFMIRLKKLRAPLVTS